MANLQAKTEHATANAKGFVADEVVTYVTASEYKKNGATFCLRLIDLENTRPTIQSATDREIHSIMNHGTEGGGGLAFMPLIKAKTNNAETDLKHFALRMSELGLPINITVWLDEESVKLACANHLEELKTYRKQWSESIIQAGFSAGFYYGGVAEESCSCDTKDTGNSVLSVVECGTSSSSHKFKSISIGDNNSPTCRIRWAYLGLTS